MHAWTCDRKWSRTSLFQNVVRYRSASRLYGCPIPVVDLSKNARVTMELIACYWQHLQHYQLNRCKFIDVSLSSNIYVLWFEANRLSLLAIARISGIQAEMSMASVQRKQMERQWNGILPFHNAVLLICVCDRYFFPTGFHLDGLSDERWYHIRLTFKFTLRCESCRLLLEGLILLC